MEIRFVRGVAVLLAAIAVCAAQAMTLERVGSDLFATGRVDDADLVAFKDALARPGLKRLVLVNSPGGDLWTAIQVARLVKSADLDTLASGGCFSACTLLFIAGRDRAFATGHRPLVTALGIHGAHDRNTGQISPVLNPQAYALYRSQIGDKFDADVMDEALYKIEDAGGMLYMRELQRNRPTDQAPWFCAKSGIPVAQCRRYVGKDAYSLGIVTRPETVEIELPAAWRVQLSFFGRALPEPSPDTVRAKVASRFAATCEEDNCKQRLEEQVDVWMTRGSYRALAIATNRNGFGAVWSASDAGAALERALYSCNHNAGGKKLCQLVALDDHDLEPFYLDGMSRSAAIRGHLSAPSPAALEAERSEPGVSTARAYRVEWREQLTPGAVAGARRVDTAEVVALLKSPQPPVLIDVAAQVPASLPTALHFVAGGLAFPDEAQEAAYDRRFRDMLGAAVPDTGAPVIFYGASASSWQSVNACLRAVKAGYTQVMWYRGGLRAWEAAGLPTVGKRPVAALQ